MAIKCSKCEKVYEISCFDGKETLACICGENLFIDQEYVFEQLNEICKQYQLKLEEEKVHQIRKMADRIVALIINADCKQDDVEIEKNKLRNYLNETSPENSQLYKLIYEPRFERLWKKFREII